MIALLGGYVLGLGIVRAFVAARRRALERAAFEGAARALAAHELGRTP